MDASVVLREIRVVREGERLEVLERRRARKAAEKMKRRGKVLVAWSGYRKAKGG